MPTIAELAGMTGSQCPSDGEPPEPWWRRLLTAQTGPGTVEDYLDHPLNWSHSVGLAQAIRGFVGLVGNELRLAIVDIIFGGLRVLTAGKGPK